MGIKRNESTLPVLWHNNIIYSFLFFHYSSLTQILYCTSVGQLWNWRGLLCLEGILESGVSNDMKIQGITIQPFPGAFHKPLLQHLLFLNFLDTPNHEPDSWRMISGQPVRHGKKSCFISPNIVLGFVCFLTHEACGILVPWPGIKPRLPAVEGQRPNHWTTRELSQ